MLQIYEMVLGFPYLIAAIHGICGPFWQSAHCALCLPISPLIPIPFLGVDLRQKTTGDHWFLRNYAQDMRVEK